MPTKTKYKNRMQSKYPVIVYRNEIAHTIVAVGMLITFIFFTLTVYFLITGGAN